MVFTKNEICPDTIKKYNKKIYSQNEEDGIIEYILQKLKVDYNNYIYIEIGTEDGAECNSRYLRENGMKGFMFDNMNENLKINLYKKEINTNNLKNILKEFNLLNKQIALFSIDIDSFDYWIFKEALNNVKSKLFVVERNDNFGCKEGFFPNEKPIIWTWIEELGGNKGQYCHTESGLYRSGAGYVSLDKLANEYNYYRVYSGRVNLYYVHKDDLPDEFEQPEDIWAIKIEMLIQKKIKEISSK